MVRAVVFKVLLAAGLAAVSSSAIAGEVTRAPEITEAGYIDARSVFGIGARSVQMERAQTRLSRKFRRETPHLVTFAPHSVRLTAEAKRALDIQARWLKRHSDVGFAVSGHADREGKANFVETLALRRARAAVAYLVARGVDEDRLIAMVGHADDAPLGALGDPMNRRTVTDVIELPRERFARTGTARKARQEGVQVASNGGTGDTGGSTGGGTGAETGGDTGGDAGNGGKDKGERGGGSQANSGRGNGAEGGDPGKSAGKNRGGDAD